MALDRRTALKKLAIGGGTVVVGTAVISSPAFAFDAPTPPAEPDVGDTSVGNFGRLLQARVRPGTATCNASATGGDSVVAADYYVSAVPGDVSVSPTTGSPIGLFVVSFDVPLANAAGTATATIDYRVRYRCTYATGTREVCRSWTLEWEYDGGWDTTPTISTPGSDCPA